MHAQTATSRYSAWADLDAIVLQEVDALSNRPAGPPVAADFASDEEFVDRVSAYLRDHEEAEALVERLSSELGLFRRPEPEDTSEPEGASEPKAADEAEPEADAAPPQPSPPPAEDADEER